MMTILWLLLGLGLGVVFLALARARWDRERRILALGLFVASAVYLGFALFAAEPQWLLIESLGIVAYSALAWFGVRYSSVWLAVGWALHTLWDVGLHLLGTGTAIAPTWYVVGCISFDLLVAVYIAARFRFS